MRQRKIGGYVAYVPLSEISWAGQDYSFANYCFRAVMKILIRKLILLVILLLGNTAQTMEFKSGHHHPQNHETAVTTCLKDESFTYLAQQIASKPAYNSIVQLKIAFSDPDNFGSVEVKCMTGLVIHPEGILSCAHGLTIDSLIELEELDSATLRAKLKYPIYMTSHNKLNQKYNECQVYFSKTYKNEIEKIESSYNTGCANLSNNQAAQDDFAFFYIPNICDLEVFA